MSNSSSQAAAAIGAEITRQIGRSAHVFATVHANQPMERLPAYATLFYDDGSDVSFELPPCFGFNCIIDTLRSRSNTEPPPVGLVIILPSLVIPDDPGAVQFMLYIETTTTPGVLMYAPATSILRRPGSSLEAPLRVYRSTDRFPTDILTRILAANDGSYEVDGDSPLFEDAERPEFFTLSACHVRGTVN